MEKVCRSYHAYSLKCHMGKRYKQIIRESDAQQCQAQWDWDMHRLIKEWHHNTAETRAPNNFGTDYYFAHLK